MTLEQKSEQESLQQDPDEILSNNAILLAQKLIANGRSSQYIQEITKLTEREVLILIEFEKTDLKSRPLHPKRRPNLRWI